MLKMKPKHSLTLSVVVFFCSVVCCLLRADEPMPVQKSPAADSQAALTLAKSQPVPAALCVPALACNAVIDGSLNEPCYRQPPLVSRFVIAGQPKAQPQATKAWLFWQQERLVFAFDVEDADPVTAPRSNREKDVDGQDRVELFLWSGKAEDTYYCLEIAGRGAVHDYSARFQREFCPAWAPMGWECVVAPTSTGYRVEGALSRSALAKIGFRLQADAEWRIGLFRADFRPDAPNDPLWLCWVDACAPQPNFHIAESFGRLHLCKPLNKTH